MPYRSIVLVLISILVLLSGVAVCFMSKRKLRRSKPTSSQYVEVREENGHYQLYRNGVPYFIKGACVYNQFKLLKETGGNSIRLYNVDADSALIVLNKAQKQGLTVTVGLDIADDGALDYSDIEAIANQLEKIKKDVIKLKDHPALLMWGIGNELNKIVEHNVYKQYRLWKEVNKIANMVHELDPNHPTTTMIPNLAPQSMLLISSLCTDIDILSLNAFWRGGRISLPKKLTYLGWNGPFVISEYGPQGYWNTTAQTDWYAKVEPTSSSKAEFIQRQYHELIQNNKNTCLGAYVFIWDQKQEYTSTWFSLFTESGEPTEMVDALQYIWTRKWPDNRAPSISKITIYSKKDSDNIYLVGGQKVQATLLARDLENDELFLNWEIHEDNVEMYFETKKGQRRTRIIDKGKMKLINSEVMSNSPQTVDWHRYRLDFKSPPQEGAYRVFVYLTDEHKKVATSNLPFYVLN